MTKPAHKSGGGTHHLSQHHRLTEVRNVTAQQRHPKQKHGSINQTEISSALALLAGNTAINQACTLLMAQSRELFGGCKTQGKDRCNDSPDKTDQLSSNSAEEKGDKSASQDHGRKLSLLYQKCKRAHDIIVNAEKMGLLDRAHGIASVPSSPHPNATISTPRSTHNTPGVVMNSMPPPPPSLAGGNVTIPSLLRQRGVSGGNPALAPSVNNRPLFKKKPSTDGSAGHAPHARIQRSLSNASESTSSSTERKRLSAPDPPLAVLDFLKKLNGPVSDSGAGAIQQPPPPVAATPAMHEGKKRKAASPPSVPSQPPPPCGNSAIRPPPPPPHSTAVRNPASSESKASSTEDILSSGQRSMRSTTKRSSPVEEKKEKVYGVGESVMVKSDGTWYAAIVKDVDCGSDNGDARGGHVTYEIEFDNGEITAGVAPKDLQDYEDE